MMSLENLVYENSNFVNNIRLSDSVDLIEELGYDSLSMVKLIIDIEKEFNIEIDNFSELHTYGALQKYVYSHMLFEEYYKNFLQGERVIVNAEYEIVISKKREEPINKKYYYSVILGCLQGKWIFSSSWELYEPLFNRLAQGEEDISKYLTNYSNLLNFEGYQTRKMVRMLWDRKEEKVFVPDQAAEYIFFESNMKYAAKIGNQVISYCKISSIQEEFGNIVVYTEPDYRRKRFAQYLLYLLLSKCKELGVYPMYVVDINNTASLGLAQKMGFSVVREEIIISKEI